MLSHKWFSVSGGGFIPSDDGDQGRIDLGEKARKNRNGRKLEESREQDRNCVRNLCYLFIVIKSSNNDGFGLYLYSQIINEIWKQITSR